MPIVRVSRIQILDIEIRLVQDGNTVDVYAGDTQLGWFESNLAGKIQFGTAYVASDGVAAFDDRGEFLTY